MAIYDLDGVRPEAEGDHWIAESASVMGRVILKKNASVWFNAVLRGDNDPITIGENTNIQDGSVLHTDVGLPLTIGKNCTIGHMVMLHGCTIGENTLIGIGSIILNGAKIGKNCLIGANTPDHRGQGNSRRLHGDGRAGQGGERADRAAGHGHYGIGAALCRELEALREGAHEDRLEAVLFAERRNRRRDSEDLKGKAEPGLRYIQRFEIARKGLRHVRLRASAKVHELSPCR